MLCCGTNLISARFIKQGKENVKGAFQAVKSNVDDVSDKVSSKVNRDIDRTQRAAERAVDAID